MSNKPHVLIVGAGMTGLLLAQKLKSHGISFSIYERDPSADCRGGGWGLAIHWALDVLLELLPEHLREQIPQTNVDPDALVEGKIGRFPFFNLVTGDTMFENVNEKRVRLQRQRLRNLMLSDLDVQVRLCFKRSIWSRLLSMYFVKVEQDCPQYHPRPRRQYHNPLHRWISSIRHSFGRMRRLPLSNQREAVW